MYKKILTILLLFSSIVVFGFGCKGMSQEQKQAVQPVELDYWTVYNNVDQLKKFAREYEQRRGYVDINIKKVRYDQFQREFVEALADDVAPDIVSIHSPWLQEQSKRLSPMPGSVNVASLQTDSGLGGGTTVQQFTNPMPSTRQVERNFVNTVSNNVIIDGEVYGLPLAIDTLALYYNEDLLDKAGVAQPPETWQDLQQAVQKSTKFDSAGNIIQSGLAMGASENINNYFDVLSMLMMQSGATLAQDQRITFANQISDNPINHPTAQALRFYTDFAKENKEVYSWNSQQESALDSFVRGNSVFYVGFSHVRDEINNRAPQMNVEVASLPQLNPSDPKNVANFWVESVVKNSENKNEAWDFVRFMSQPENIQEYLSVVKQPTPLRSQIESQKQGMPEVAPFLENILVAKSWYKGRDIGAAKRAFADMITSFKQPLPEDTDRGEMNTRIISNAARTIQQTM